MMIRTVRAVLVTLLLAMLAQACQAAPAVATPEPQDAPARQPAANDDGCQTKTVQSMAEIEACRHPEQYRRMQHSLGLSKLYLGAVGALIAVSLLYFGDLGWGPILKYWLICGLGGFLASLWIAQLLGAAITGVGALALYFMARSPSLE